MARNTFILDECMNDIKKSSHVLRIKRPLTQLEKIPLATQTEIDSKLNITNIYSKIASHWRKMACITHQPNEELYSRNGHDCYISNSCHPVNLTSIVFFVLKNKPNDVRMIHQELIHDTSGEKENILKREKKLTQQCWKCCRCPGNLVYRQYTSSRFVSQIDENDQDSAYRTSESITIKCFSDLVIKPGYAGAPRIKIPGFMKGNGIIKQKGNTKSSTARRNTDQPKKRIQKNSIPQMIQLDILKRSSPVGYYLNTTKPEKNVDYIAIPLFLKDGKSIHAEQVRTQKDMMVSLNKTSRQNQKQRTDTSLFNGHSDSRKRKKLHQIIRFIENPSYYLQQNPGLINDSSLDRIESDGEEQTVYDSYIVDIHKTDWIDFLERLRLIETSDGRIETINGESVNIGTEEVCMCECCKSRKMNCLHKYEETKEKEMYHKDTTIKKRQHNKFRNDPQNPLPSGDSSIWNGSEKKLEKDNLSKDILDTLFHKCCGCNTDQVIINIDENETDDKVGESNEEEKEIINDDCVILHVCISEGFDLVDADREKIFGKNKLVCFGGTVPDHSIFVNRHINDALSCKDYSIKRFLLNDAYVCSKTGLVHVCIPSRCMFAKERHNYNITKSDTVCPFSGKVLSDMMLVDGFWKPPGVSNSGSAEHKEKNDAYGTSPGNSISPGKRKRRDSQPHHRMWGFGRNTPVAPPTDWDETLGILKEMMLDPLIDSKTINETLKRFYPINQPSYKEYLAEAMVWISSLMSAKRLSADMEDSKKTISVATKTACKKVNNMNRKALEFVKTVLEVGYNRLYDKYMTDAEKKEIQEKKKSNRKKYLEQEEPLTKKPRIDQYQSTVNQRQKPNIQNSISTKCLGKMIYGRGYGGEMLKEMSDNLFKPNSVLNVFDITAKEIASSGGVIMLMDSNVMCLIDGITDEEILKMYSNPSQTLTVEEFLQIPSLAKYRGAIKQQHITDIKKHYPDVYKALVYPIGHYRNIFAIRNAYASEIAKKPKSFFPNITGKPRVKFINVYAHQVVSLWCAIKTINRTYDVPFEFKKFQIFVIASMYVFKKGVCIPKNDLNSVRDLHVLERDIVLSEILPVTSSTYLTPFRKFMLDTEREIQKFILKAILKKRVPTDAFKLAVIDITNQDTRHVFPILRKSIAPKR